MTSPDFELILGRSEKFPPVPVQLHSAYMHSIDIDRALDPMEVLLRHEVFAGAYWLTVSRIDIYADFLGWEPQVTDLDRFVSFSRHRRGFQENQQLYMTGPPPDGLHVRQGRPGGADLRQDGGDPAARRELKRHCLPRRRCRALHCARVLLS